MGADLISYIALGPEQISLDEEKKAQIVKRVREYLDACIAAAESLLLGKKEVPAPRSQPVEAKCSLTLRFDSPPEMPTFKRIKELRGHKDYRSLIEQALDACGYCVEAKHIFLATLEDLAKMVQGFVDDWNKPSFRDMATRQDPDHPDRKVVIAGDMSWGDEPDGAGYQMLKRAFGLSIAQFLGVK
jgi:hypothetical protein